MEEKRWLLPEFGTALHYPVPSESGERGVFAICNFHTHLSELRTDVQEYLGFRYNKCRKCLRCLL